MCEGAAAIVVETPDQMRRLPSWNAIRPANASDTTSISKIDPGMT
jgi:hypothetical protein